MKREGVSFFEDNYFISHIFSYAKDKTFNFKSNQIPFVNTMKILTKPLTGTIVKKFLGKKILNYEDREDKRLEKEQKEKKEELSRLKKKMNIKFSHN